MATNASLDGVPLLIDPTSVRWNFRVKMSEQRTVGGKVIQIFGTDLGDMTVEVEFGSGNAERGDTAGWEAAERFYARMEELAERTATSTTAPPLVFAMPSKRWSFRVHLKDVSPLVHSNKQPNPKLTLTLFIVEDSTGRVVKGIRDKYIERLMAGIGWEQSEFNGPTTEEVEQTLSPYGGSVNTFFERKFLEQWSQVSGQAMVGGPIGGGGAVNVMDPEGLQAYLYALRMVESNNNYTALNPYTGDASGAYQYIDSTWARYKGYVKAMHAPPAIQDERAAIDASRDFNKHHDWGAVATIHFTGHYVSPTDPKYDQVPGHSSNITIRAYVDRLFSHMAQYPGV